jgi:AraC-like DNA-binding protein
MDAIHQGLIEREARRLEAGREELVERVARAVPKDGAAELPGGLRLFRASAPSEPEHGISYPALCLVVQGRKEVTLGDDLYFYDANQYLITAAALPIESRFTEASKEWPCLGIVLKLEPAVVGSVIVEAIRPTQRNQTSTRAFNVSPLEAGLLDALIRLMGLLDVPEDEARFLRPLITREIIFRLLKGEQGGWLRHTAVVGGHSHRIAGALERLRKDFSKPLRIEEFAHDIGMSVSSFHHHFKAVTAMSPVQFQKRMRLQEARRLMLSENLDAASAGFRVGYEDTSHFSREYKRHFGQPPRRDVQRLRETTGAVGAEV